MMWNRAENYFLIDENYFNLTINIWIFRLDLEVVKYPLSNFMSQVFYIVGTTFDFEINPRNKIYG